MTTEEWIAGVEGQLDAITLLVAAITATSPAAEQIAQVLTARVQGEAAGKDPQGVSQSYIRGMSKVLAEVQNSLSNVKLARQRSDATLQ